MAIAQGTIAPQAIAPMVHPPHANRELTGLIAHAPLEVAMRHNRDDDPGILLDTNTRLKRAPSDRSHP
jgi:hypothetical protein